MCANHKSVDHNVGVRVGGRDLLARGTSIAEGCWGHLDLDYYRGVEDEPDDDREEDDEEEREDNLEEIGISEGEELNGIDVVEDAVYSVKYKLKVSLLFKYQRHQKTALLALA